MPAIVVVGAQWGDEGKGKVTDMLAEGVDMVVRYQGGANAGHTMVINGKKVVTNQLPSGVARDKLCAMTRGMSLNPSTLIDEIERVNSQLKSNNLYFSESNLMIDEAVSLTMPWNILEDVMSETLKSKGKVGSTGRGIGPTYKDWVGRTALRAVDLMVDDTLAAKIEQMVDEKNAFLSFMFERINRMPGRDENRLRLEKLVEDIEKNSKINLKQFCKTDANGNLDLYLGMFDHKKVLAVYTALAERLAPMIMDASSEINRMLKNGKTVLCEGAQGFALSYVHGTYPFVTSSNPIANSAASSIGFDPKYVERAIGVVKAYTTRVGAGPFCSELANEERLTAEIKEYIAIHGKDAPIMLSDEERAIINANDDTHSDYNHVVAKELAGKGGEFGTTTGRLRRCGWFEAPVVRRAVEAGGITELALTKLDVLDNLPEVKLTYGYDYEGPENRFTRKNGKTFTDFPVSSEIYANCKPKSINVEGWKTDISNITKYDDLPQNAKYYIETLEAYSGCNISMVSIGPDREQTLIRK